MSVLLAIISSPGDNELLARNWPFLKIPGWPILGCGTVDGKTEWPETVERLNTGKLGRVLNAAGLVIPGLVEQELDIWRWFLEHKEYDSVAVVEADNVFVRQPPQHPGNGMYLVTALPNYSRHGLFQNPVYFSTPRHADRSCVERLHAHGRDMFAAGQTELKVSDRFPSLICHRHNIPWISQPSWSPSAFAFGAANHAEAWKRDMRAAVAIGCYALHSVKTPEQLQLVKDAMKEFGLPCPA